MVYFIKAENRLKIGYAEDPSKRIPSIQTSSPFQLEVLLIIDGDYSIERDLHQKFQDFRVSGEWFEFNDDIKSFINEHLVNDRKYEFGFENSEFLGNQQLKRLRKTKKMSLGSLGQILNMTKQSVSEFETREELGSITLNNLKKIGNALGCKLEYRFVPIEEEQERPANKT
jgi:DNA-binding Xre family transcriptional regulator